MRLFQILTSFFILFIFNNFTLAEPTATIEALPEDSIYLVEHGKTTDWITQDGKSLKLSDFRGQTVVISMVYMTCKFSCPLTIAHMKTLESAVLQKGGPSLRKKTQFLLVSFDPLRDTPAVMAEFAKKSHLKTPDWTFITSPKESAIRELSTLIDFKYKKLENGEFEHSFAIVVLDPKGRVLGRTEGAEMKPESLLKFF